MSTATLERPGYTTVEVSKFTKLTYRRIDYWTRKGYIKPELTEADGPGSRRRWSERQLDQFRVIAEAEKSLGKLFGTGAEVKWMTPLLKAMRREPDSHAWVIESGTATIVVRRP